MTITLSPRQLQIVELLSRGKRTEEIAEIVGVKPRSIYAYLHLAYKKTGTRNVRELAQKISAVGLDGFKHTQIPHRPADRIKLMTRLRWRDGENCCICGQLIDFRIRHTGNLEMASFWYEATRNTESDIKLAHRKCNPLVGSTRIAGENAETIDENVN